MKGADGRAPPERNDYMENDGKVIALLIDAVAYACYLFFLSKAEENMGKLWFAFILAYVLASSDKLAIVWQMLAANASTH